MDSTTSRPDLGIVFAQHAAQARFDDLPKSAVERAKQSILDTIGIIHAASGMEPASRVAVEFAQQTGGTPEATILGFGDKVPAMMAAFANGAMAHSLDYDDQTPWGQHAASSLVPAVLAISERQGAVSGKELITAVAIGQDMFNRLRQHTEWRKDWFFTTTIGVFCATAASARLLGLSAPEIANALGIASVQSAGTFEIVTATGSNLRAVYAGFPAKNAVMAALLAQKGIGGISTLFEGPNGMLPLLFGDRVDMAGILRDLGTDFAGGQTLYKRWPAVGTSHSHIHATIGLVQDHGLRAADIRQINIFVGDFHKLMSEPLAQRRAPTTLVDAKFSLPYLVAVAATNGELNLSDFTPQALESPYVRATAEKVIPIEDRSLNWDLDLPPGRVEIIMNDGRRFTRVGNRIPGSPENPMTWQDLFDKFSDCASASAVPLPAETIRQTCEIAENLEAAVDATELVRMGDRQH